jgi:hypothetical protein
MIRFTVDTAGLAAMLGKLTGLMSALKDRSEAHEKIKVKQNERWVVNFTGQGSEYQKWAALSPDWVAQRGSSAPILRMGGSLFGNVESQQNAATVGQDATEWNFSDQPMNFPMTHHLGKATAFNLPARPIWLTDGEDDERNRQIMEEYVDMVVSRFN